MPSPRYFIKSLFLLLKAKDLHTVWLFFLQIKAQKYGWKAMETLCQNAWDISDSIDGLISSSSSSLYTTTTYCNIMMEAATGFENVFPASLLGAVNAEIYEKRTLYLDLLEAESAALASLLEVREKSSVLKKEMSLCSANSLEKMKNQAVLNGEQQAELLKKRQEQKLSTYGNYSSVDLPSFESESAPYKCTTFITSSIETPKVSDMPPSPSCPLLLQATSRTLTAIRSKVTDLRALVRRKGSYQSSIEPGKLRALRCHRHSIRAESARVVQNELRRYQNILGEQKAVEEKARLLHAVLLVRKVFLRAFLLILYKITGK